MRAKRRPELPRRRRQPTAVEELDDSLGILDKLAAMLPEIKKPGTPQTFRRKLVWLFAAAVIYAVLFWLRPIGVYSIILPQLAGSYNFLVVGIAPILIVNLFAMIAACLGRIKTDFKDPDQMAAFQRRLKLVEIVLAVLFSLVFSLTISYPAYLFPVLWLELLLGSVLLIYLDEFLYKYSFTSGINLFVLLTIAYQFISVFVAELGSIPGCFGVVTAISCIAGIEAPLVSVVIVFAATYYTMMQFRSENETVRQLSKGLGARMPLYFLSVSFFALYLANIADGFLKGVLQIASVLLGSSQLTSFMALFQAAPSVIGSARSVLVGGLAYLISFNFPLAYPTSMGGIGGYNQYYEYLANHTSQLVFPFGGSVLVPEWAHVIVATLVYLVLVAAITRLLSGLFRGNLGAGSGTPKAVMEQSVVLLFLVVLQYAAFANGFSVVSAVLIFYFLLEEIRGQAHSTAGR